MIKVRTGELLSDAEPFGCGVRQGCPSFPILFDLYINDLLDGLNDVNVPNANIQVPGLFFADDAVLFANTTEQLRHDVRRIYKWCDK